jgi:hypothetical protein
MASAEEPTVICPSGLRWSNEGYCVNNIDPRSKNQICPNQSVLSKPHVTDDLMCTAKGRCPNPSMQPDRFGVCKDKSKPKTFPNKQKQNM